MVALLFTAILAFAGIVVLAITNGGSIDFWGIHISFGNDNGKVENNGGKSELSVKDFIATLPDEVQGTAERARDNIIEKIKNGNRESAENEDLKKQLGEMGSRIAQLQKI